MTSQEISLITKILEERFGYASAAVSGTLLENGEMSVGDLFQQLQRMSKTHPADFPDKAETEKVLHILFQYDVLKCQRYPEMPDDEAIISIDMDRVFYFLMEPLLCYAVEEILGDDVAHLLSLVLALGSQSVELLLHTAEGIADPERALMELIRAKIVLVLDRDCRYDDPERFLSSPEVTIKKSSWLQYVIKGNPDRLFVIFLLYLTQSKVESDPALGAVGCEVFLGLCRASLFCTSLRATFLCDELFFPVSATDVMKHLPESATEGMDLSIVTQNLSRMVCHVEAFLLDSGNKTFTLKGSRLLGMWAEHFLYEVIKAEVPQVSMARPLMQYLVRNRRPYVQAKVIEAELYGNTHAFRYASNELCRLGFIDLMGTSHVASYEPGRTEIFLCVNLPRLFRQKLYFEQCLTLLRTKYSMEKHLTAAHEKQEQRNKRRAGAPSVASVQNHEIDDPSVIAETYAKMEIGFMDAFTFSALYIQATARIGEVDHSKDAFSLLEFFGRRPIPEEMSES